jgi:hypothetical protein
MPNSEGDIAGFLRDMVRGPASERRTKPLVGIDECLNCPEISKLTRLLLQRNLIEGSNPLWYETREKYGVVVGSFIGGVKRDSLFRKSNQLITDVGVPVKHRSWSDFRIVQMLVVHFITYDNLILLSENTRNNPDGLRRILKEVVRPALASRRDPLCLTALFKRGKTSIADYCLGVTSFLEKSHRDLCYVEVLL